MSKYDHLIGNEVASGTWSWNQDKVMLYAVGVGVGTDDNQAELHFATENLPGKPLQVIPTFPALMGVHGNWIEALGLNTKDGNTVGLVHGEEGVTLHRPIPVEGSVRLSKRLKGVFDKGSGMLIQFETHCTLAGSDELLATVEMRLFALGFGGFGGPRNPPEDQPWELPTRAPDHEISYSVGRNQSLIYRLSGDHHPHGTQHARALLDGFERPILYGLGSYGYTARALMQALTGSESAPFRQMHARFSKPVYPGDRLDIRIWNSGDGTAQFQTLANGERIVLDRGSFRYAT
ncbi:MAG: MaoC family dehydratase N-terminal domain-containing protein [Sphingomonadales bacterium]|nr:MaoC family dehydratase N-terminal domain-containing protein [Sphingomonadales bacterium]